MGELHIVRLDYVWAAIAAVAAVLFINLWLVYRRSRVLTYVSRTNPGRIYGTERVIIYGLLVTAASGVIALLLLQPFLRTMVTHKIYEPLHFVVAIDGSYSVLAQARWDPCGPSRLSLAKEQVGNFLTMLERESVDKIGLIVFSRFGYRLVPVLTDDYQVVRRVLRDFSEVEIAEGGLLSGTNHWDAVLEATKIFEEDSQRKQVLIILTDGEPDGPPEILDKSRQEALTAVSSMGGLSTYVIGIGYPYEKFPIPATKDSRGCPTMYMIQEEGEDEGTIVMTSMDSMWVRAMTRQLGGDYMHAYSGDELTGMLKGIMLRERVAIGSRTSYADRDLSRELLIALLVLMPLIVIAKSP